MPMGLWTRVSMQSLFSAPFPRWSYPPSPMISPPPGRIYLLDIGRNTDE